MDLDEINKTFKATLYNRLGNPFTVAFVLSWFVWNWKFWATLFFNSPGVDDKIKYLTSLYSTDLHLFNQDWHIGTYWFYIGLVAPVISSIIVITLLPRLTISLYRIHLAHNKKRLDLKRKIQVTTLLSVEESDNMYHLINETKKELVSINKVHKEETERLIRISEKEKQEIQESFSAYKLKTEKIVNNSTKKIEINDNNTSNFNEEFKKILKYKAVSNNIKEIIDTVTRGHEVNNDRASKEWIEAIAYLNSNNILDGVNFSDKGTDFLKFYFDEKDNNGKNKEITYSF